MERIWRREGLKVPQKQKPRGRLWLNDGSCVRLRPEHQSITSGRTTSSARSHTMEGQCACSTSSTNIRGSAWPFMCGGRINSANLIDVLADAYDRTRHPRNTSALTTALSSWPSNCANGWHAPVLPRCTSNPALHGRTATVRASTPSCAMSSSMAKSFALAEGSASAGRTMEESTTTPSGHTLSLGYHAAGAPRTWQPEASLEHGKVESKQCFPLFHAPDCGGELTNSPSALH